MGKLRENSLEFYTNYARATVTLSQDRFVSKIRKLAIECPDDEKILKQNGDGTIAAHIPMDFIKIRKLITVSRKSKETLAKRLSMMRERKASLKE